MKKRILALLLAGLITASLASCVSSSNRPDETDGESGTEEDQTRPEEESSTEEETDNVTWEDASGTVYVISASLTLTPLDTTNQSIKVSLMDELTLVKTSPDVARSIVEKDGVQYYVPNTSISDQDLLGKNFTACNEKMYVTQSAHIRTYASIDNFSASVGTLAVGAEVTVVAKGTSCEIPWCKIEYLDTETNETKYYFVSENLLSSDPNGDDPVDYSSFFTDCEEPFLMYVRNDASLNLRETPLAENNSNIKKQLLEKTKVTILAQGKDDYASWYYVEVDNEKVPGMPQTTAKGYVNAAFLDPTDGSLEQLIAYYNLTAYTATLYSTTDGLGVRSTPYIPTKDETGNRVADLQKKESVKVVATGLVNDIQWCMIECEIGSTEETKETVYRFVSANYLTTDPEGNAMITLETLLATNPEFTQTETEYTVYATEKTYGFTELGAEAPSVTDAKLEIAAAKEMTVVATGTKYNLEMYIAKDSNGALYFVFAEFFSTTAAVG